VGGCNGAQAVDDLDGHVISQGWQAVRRVSLIDRNSSPNNVPTALGQAFQLGNIVMVMTLLCHFAVMTGRNTGACF
jgi:hypothetical protein